MESSLNSRISRFDPNKLNNEVIFLTLQVMSNVYHHCTVWSGNCQVVSLIDHVLPLVGQSSSSVLGQRANPFGRVTM